MTHHPMLSRTLALGLMLACAAAPALAQDDQTTPPWSMADQYYGEEAMARSRDAVRAANGAQSNSMIMADRFEIQSSDQEDTALWDANIWYGGDINKLWIKTEGDFSLTENAIEEAEVQALWSRAISPYFDLQAGVRYDFAPKGRTHAVIGVQGLAPYWFEIDAAAFISTQGNITTRIEAEYELLLTQRLILQPRAELELSAQDIPERDIGSGLTSLNAGLRLRYETVREFAPYVGIEWQGHFGDTKDMIKAAGGETDRTVFVIGVRAWY